jgi:hypothetical protein
MSIPGSANPLLLKSAASATYSIGRSLRFNAPDSAYLSRTPSVAGNRKTWTWAGWVKRSTLSSGGAKGLFLGGTNPDRWCIEFSNDYLYVGGTIGGSDKNIAVSALFRDVSAWYHIVIVCDTTQSTSTDRIKFYSNGVRLTDFVNSTGFPAQNTDLAINNTVAHQIGNDNASSDRYFDGYLADIHFIDGQALTPTSFGEFDTNGIWQPKAFTGSYGTNGFHLPFSDNSAATAAALGKDTSGNGNNFTPSNLSVTAGAGNDSLVDVPTNGSQTDTGVGGEVRGNYCCLNPLQNGGNTLSNGNLDAATVSNKATASTIGVSSGKWYCEVTVNTINNGGQVGIATNAFNLNTYLGGDANGWAYAFDGKKANNASVASYGATYTTNDVIGIALDLDAGTLVFYKNGSSQGTAYSSLPAGTYFFAFGGGGTTPAFSLSWNFGQRPFAYPVSGFKALCTANLPAPTIVKPSTVMDVALWTGTGATLTATSSLGFSPDLVWIKSRSAATDNTIYDAVRGAQARLESNNTDAEVTSDGGLTAFNSNGFTLGTLAQVNTNSATYAGWCWDRSVSAGFDIVTYTGNGSNRTISHSLGVAPQLIIVKQRTAASTTNWAVWHSSLANTEYLLLNTTGAKATGATYWNSTSPTSSVFSLGTAADVNTNAGTYVAYLWAPVAGFSALGSYTGNGSADGPFVYTGMRPRYLLVKRTDAISSWEVYDAARNPSNLVTQLLEANTAGSEFTGTTNYVVDFLSNGFKPRGTFTDLNASGGTYIYAAFAEAPFSIARAR